MQKQIPIVAAWRDFDQQGSPILTNQQLRQADLDTAKRLPSLLLMEQAAMQICRYLEACPPPLLVLVGPGNNGGDGLAIARMLLSRKIEVDLWLAASDMAWTGDAATNFSLLQPLLAKAETGGQIFSPACQPDYHHYRCVIDCLFGSGLNRKLSPPYTDLIDQVNSLPLLRVAVDIPSGLRGDSPLVATSCFHADATLAIAAARMAHLLQPAASQCGLLHIVPIGISQQTIDEQPSRWTLLGRQQLKLRPRPRHSHKGDYGHLLIVGGCLASSGALQMAAQAALRSGAGLVSVAGDRQILAQLGNNLADVQWLALPENEQRPFDWQALARYSALAIGCGWGRTPQRRWLLAQLLRHFDGPLLLDADALDALSQAPELLGLLRDRSILTPHLGELAKLLQRNKQQLLDQRTQLSQQFAQQHQLWLVAKSSETLICAPDGRSWVVNRGNASLARGGSGDNLAGLIGGLLAQGYPPGEAARLGVWLLGRAAEIASSQTNHRGLISSQLPLHFAAAFDQLEPDSPIP